MAKETGFHVRVLHAKMTLVFCNWTLGQELSIRDTIVVKESLAGVGEADVLEGVARNGISTPEESVLSIDRGWLGQGFEVGQVVDVHSKRSQGGAQRYAGTEGHAVHKAHLAHHPKPCMGFTA